MSLGTLMDQSMSSVSVIINLEITTLNYIILLLQWLLWSFNQQHCKK